MDFISSPIGELTDVYHTSYDVFSGKHCGLPLASKVAKPPKYMRMINHFSVWFFHQGELILQIESCQVDTLPESQRLEHLNDHKNA